MSKIVLLNDTHFGVRNSSDIFIEYHRRFFEETFFPYVKKARHQAHSSCR